MWGTTINGRDVVVIVVIVIVTIMVIMPVVQPMIAQYLPKA